MISIKTDAEVKSMREAGQITASVLNIACNAVTAGISTLEIDQLIGKELAARGAKSASLGYTNGNNKIPFPANACISLNDEIVHGIPSETRIINSGDIVSIDLVAVYDGLMADSTRTVVVGEVSSAVTCLVNETKIALNKGIEQAIDGNRVGNISAAIEKHAKKFGFGIVRELVGHGIGREMHEQPNIPNWGKASDGPILKAGMTIAIEPMLMLGGEQLRMAKDGWTILTADGKYAAHWEHTILVTKNNPEVLTELRK